MAFGWRMWVHCALWAWPINYSFAIIFFRSLPELRCNSNVQSGKQEQETDRVRVMFTDNMLWHLSHSFHGKLNSPFIMSQCSPTHWRRTIKCCKIFRTWTFEHGRVQKNKEWCISISSWCYCVNISCIIRGSLCGRIEQFGPASKQCTVGIIVLAIWWIIIINIRQQFDQFQLKRTQWLISIAKIAAGPIDTHRRFKLSMNAEWDAMKIG